MDTELQHLEDNQKSPSSSPKVPVSSIPSSILTSASSKENDIVPEDVPRYTSLRDVFMSASSSPKYPCNYDSMSEFDPTSITIRNQLVKHAASAYVQSATPIATQNQNWLFRLWERVRVVSNNSDWVRRWLAFVWYPLRACFRPLYYSLEYIVEHAFHSVIRV